MLKDLQGVLTTKQPQQDPACSHLAQPAQAPGVYPDMSTQVYVMPLVSAIAPIPATVCGASPSLPPPRVTSIKLPANTSPAKLLITLPL